MGCTPTRVDHLDFTTNPINIHEVARLVPVLGGGNVFYIVYMATQSAAAGQRGGIFLRTWNVDTATLSAVRNVAIDNSGAGRFGSVVSDNRWPQLAQMSDGRLICIYSGNAANSQGMFVRESTDQGVTWSAETQLRLPLALSSNQDQIEINDIQSDGTDVFALCRSEAGSANGDFFLWKRTGLGTWTVSKIFNATSSTQAYQFSRSAPGAFTFKRVGISPATWKIAIVFEFHDTAPTPDVDQVRCIYNQAHDDNFPDGDESANWTNVLIRDMNTANNFLEPIVLAGTDDVLRCIWVLNSTNDVYSADSSDWGQTWNDRGPLTVPNTKNWESSHNRTSTLNSADDWFISTISGSNEWYAFRNTGVEEGGWTLDASCTIDSPFLVEQANGCGTSLILPDTKLSRLTHDAATPGSFYRIWLTTLSITPPAGPEPPPCTITGTVTVCPGESTQLCGPVGDGFTYLWTRPDGSTSTQRCIPANQYGTYTLVVTDQATGLFTACDTIVTQPEDCPDITTASRLYRRGYIKVIKSAAPQPGYTAAPMEKHDGPLWGGS